MNHRKYHIDFTKPDKAAHTILRMHIDTLVSCQEKANQSEELKWEIRLYEYMLQDPVKRLQDYRDTRYIGNKRRSNRETVKILGWDIP